MSAFAPVTAGMDFLQISISNEIIEAARERASVCELYLGPGLAYAGLDAHKTVIGNPETDVTWKYLQSLCEYLATTYYLDPTPGVGGYAGAGDISPFTLASFRAASGLHSAGFRRAAEWDPDVDDWTDLDDPMFSYGVIQVGDIFGPWIYADLQAALSVLLWTRVEASDQSAQWYAKRHRETNSQAEFGINCSAIRTKEIAAWAASSWLTTLVDGGYVAATGLWDQNAGSDPPLSPAWECFGTRGAVTFAAVDDTFLLVLPADLDLYLKFGPIEGYDFLDIDGLGAVEGEWHFADTLPAVEPPALPRVGSELGGFGTNPLLVAGLVCEDGGKKAIQSSETCWVARWHFTRQ